MKNKIIKGGEFLIKETDASDIFIPEEFDEEQNMIAQSSQDFLDQEVYPNWCTERRLNAGALN